MTIGTVVTKTTIDNALSNTARVIHLQLTQDVPELKHWADANGAAGLTALGYTAAEATTVISAINDLNALSQIYLGAATLAVAYDYRTFLKQAFGLPAL